MLWTITAQVIQLAFFVGSTFELNCKIHHLRGNVRDKFWCMQPDAVREGWTRRERLKRFDESFLQESQFVSEASQLSSSTRGSVLGALASGSASNRGSVLGALASESSSIRGSVWGSLASGRLAWALVLLHFIHGGEASNPGPSDRWTLGTFNPSGLNGKQQIISEHLGFGDIWAISETHLSSRAFQSFKKRALHFRK